MGELGAALRFGDRPILLDAVEKRSTSQWTVTIYRIDSRTPVVYENVKHAWWEGKNYVVAQFDGDGPEHHYWTWPGKSISHVKEKKSE